MDEEEYSSDTSDEDYVPNEGERLSEEEESGDNEDFMPAEGSDSESAQVGVRRRDRNHRPRATKQKRTSRKSNSTTETLDQQQPTASHSLLAKTVSEEQNKKRADDLWSDFIKDVGSSRSSALNKISDSGSSALSEKVTKPQSTVTITKEYDFAGETVTVVKEVSADSKDAKLAVQDRLPSKSVDLEVKETTAEPSPTSSVGVKRPATAAPPRGLNSVLDKIGKKPKMSVLEKSKIDWDGFKKTEGIDNDLKIHNRGKGGYLERQAFLQRADNRQFEIERGLRLGSRTSALHPPPK